MKTFVMYKTEPRTYHLLNMRAHSAFISVLKASIIGRKKEAAAEKLQEAMDEVKYFNLY